MHLTIYTDGACQPNPGPCGCGVVLLDQQEKIVGRISEYLGEGTNNLGELTGILRGVRRAKELGYQKVTIYTDSEVCLKILRKGSTSVKPLAAVLDLCKEAMKDMDVQLEWVKGHAGMKWNELADQLANASIAFLNPQVPKQSVARGSDSPTEMKPKADVIYLRCPFAEKDEAKAMGARWDAAAKKWVVTDTPDNRAKFIKWIPSSNHGK